MKHQYSFDPSLSDNIPARLKNIDQWLNTDFTKKYLTQQQTEFNRQVSYPPYAGSVFFQLGSCKVCWIKGGWINKTAEVVEDFIDNQDLINFLQNI